MTTPVDTAPFPRHDITGIVLAGGQSRRMGGADKAWLELAGKPMVMHVLAALSPQVGAVLVSANRHGERYRALGYPVVADGAADFLGPLAGMVAAVAAIATPYIATVPCDSPLLPADLVARLYYRLRENGADVSVAHDGQRLQPVFVLMKCESAVSAQEYLQAGERKLDRWLERQRLVITYFNDVPQAFANVNNSEDLAELTARMTAR